RPRLAQRVEQQPDLRVITEGGHRERPHHAELLGRHDPHVAHSRATSTSISTAPPRGRAATPTADRECRPAAPKTSAMSFDAPSTTAGCASNPGALAT